MIHYLIIIIALLLILMNAPNPYNKPAVFKQYFYGTAVSFFLYPIKNSFLGNGHIDNIWTTNSYLFQNVFYTMENHSDVEIWDIRD